MAYVVSLPRRQFVIKGNRDINYCFVFMPTWLEWYFFYGTYYFSVFAIVRILYC